MLHVVHCIVCCTLHVAFFGSAQHKHMRAGSKDAARVHLRHRACNLTRCNMLSDCVVKRCTVSTTLTCGAWCAARASAALGEGASKAFFANLRLPSIPLAFPLAFPFAFPFAFPLAYPLRLATAVGAVSSAYSLVCAVPSCVVDDVSRWAAESPHDRDSCSPEVGAGLL